MTKRATRVAAKNPAPRSESAESIESALRGTFTSAVVDELREQTGYNPRQRSITAQRLMLVVVEAFLLGQTLGFTALRAIFVRRFGFVSTVPVGCRIDIVGDRKTDIVQIWPNCRTDMAIRDRNGRNLLV